MYIPIIIRWFLSIFLIIGVYFETGIFTSITATLLILKGEIEIYNKRKI